MCVFTARTMLDVESCRRRQLHLGSNFSPQNGPQNLPPNWGAGRAHPRAAAGGRRLPDSPAAGPRAACWGGCASGPGGLGGVAPPWHLSLCCVGRMFGSRPPWRGSGLDSPPTFGHGPLPVHVALLRPGQWEGLWPVPLWKWIHGQLDRNGRMVWEQLREELHVPDEIAQLRDSSMWSLQVADLHVGCGGRPHRSSARSWASCQPWSSRT